MLTIASSPRSASRRPKGRLVALCALLAMLPASMVHAQTRLDQRWSAASNTIAERPVFSRNGAYVLLRSEGDYKIGRVSDGATIASLGAANPLAGTFSGNSAYAYISTGSKVLMYRVLDGLYQSVLLTDPNAVEMMTTSRDGKYLVYVSHNTVAGTYELVNYDVLTAAEVFRTPLPAKPSSLYISYDITKIIVDGPDVYSVTTGAQILDSNVQAGQFAISRYGDYAYGRNAVDPSKLESRRTTDGSLQWSVPFPVTGYTGDSIQTTGNGDRILIAGRDPGTGKPKVWVLRPGNGTTSSTAMPAVRADLSTNLADNVAVSLSPNTYDLVLTQKITPASGSPFVVNEMFTLGATSTFDSYRDASTISYPIAAIASTAVSLPSIEAPLVALGATSGSSTVGGIQLRNGTTGQILKTFPGYSFINGRPDSLALNPSGTTAVFTQPGTGITAISTDTGALLGTVNVNAYSYEFVDDNHFWASLSDNTLRKYEITGVGVVQQASITSVTASNYLTINPAGTLAVVIGPDVRQFTRVELGTGNKRIQAVANAGGANKYVKFVNDGTLYVGWENPSNYVAMRSYDISGATNIPIRTYSRQVVAAYDRSVFGVSNDGKTISIGNSRWAAPGTDDRIVGDLWVYSSVTASLLLAYRDQQLGTGFNAFLPTADGAGAIWSRQDPGALMVKYVPIVESVSISPNTVVGGNPTTGTITLTAPANSGGLVVALTSNNPAVVVPANVTVLGGDKTATFSITTNGVTSNVTATVTATAPGRVATATLTVTPPTLTGVSVAPGDVYGGNTAIGTVTLDGTAGAAITVNLSGDVAEATVPATVTIPAGSSSANFNIPTTSVDTTKLVTVTASWNGTTKTTTFNLKPNAPASVTFSASKVWAGTSVTGTVTLKAPAKAGGETVTLSGSSANATIPATITVPAGSLTATFTASVNTNVTAEETFTVTATLNGETAAGSFDLRLAGIASYTLSRTTAQGGNSVVATVTLTAPAPAGGLVVNLTTNNQPVARPASATITIPAGATSGTVTITTSVVTVNTAVTLTAERDGSSKSVVLNVAKPR